MADIDIVFDGTQLHGDFVLGTEDVETGHDLVTSVIVSLFTQPGWWADAYEPDKIGCRLLELIRAKRTTETLLRARDYCRQALAWLLEDGVARAVDVVTEWQGSLLAVAITIAQASGVSRFSFVWEAV